ncbi:uncharacterized protein LOC128203712 isoform X1 [Mya arenaria]|uniref:uncharacterized protein LOC128203544 isoform X1 n=2 Tax=Mya arenaria TaxID=6604 RepID=UPI0022E86647|nr:uncharacterized protein LOC128203544 isoform X1 [Mya arenaria]XP_052761193.1 uncharacterized protein LOC128203712 isoform X1 [Mya arenaria]
MCKQCIRVFNLFQRRRNKFNNKQLINLLCVNTVVAGYKMGCTQSTPSRTRQRRRGRAKHKLPLPLESKEIAYQKSAAPPLEAATFFARRDQFQAPESNYKSEHIDQVTEIPITVVSHIASKQATYTGIYNVRVHHADAKECRIRGAEFLPTGNLLLVDSVNHKLKLLSSTFQYLAHFVFNGCPHDLCLHSSNRDGSDVYVTVPSDRCVHEFYVEDRFIMPGRKFFTDGWCYGIAAYKQGLVVSVGTKVEFIDTDGTVLKVLQYSTSGMSLFGSPFNIAVTGAQNIIIADSIKNFVTCITPDGNEIFRYKAIGIPHYVMVDGDDNLYICGNEKGAIDVLHQVTVRGEKVKSLLSWRHVGFTPHSIAYREKDQLLVVCGENDRIKTFRLETRRSGKSYMNDAIMDSERIQTERSTREVQEMMRRILDR